MRSLLLALVVAVGGLIAVPSAQAQFRWYPKYYSYYYPAPTYSYTPGTYYYPNYSYYYTPGYTSYYSYPGYSTYYSYPNYYYSPGYRSYYYYPGYSTYYWGY